MFKKLNKLYTAVFGEDQDNVPVRCGSDEIRLPLQPAVRELEWKVKKLTKVIEALLAYNNVELDDNWSELSNDYTFVIKKKK